MPLAFRLPILVPQKGNQLERFICMHYLSGRYGCPIHYPKTALFVVIANDQYLADPVSSAY